jgi:hypothetical protein
MILTGEAADANAGEIADKEACLAAEIFLNTSVIVQRASIANSEGTPAISGRYDNRNDLLPNSSSTFFSIANKRQQKSQLIEIYESFLQAVRPALGF